MRFPGFATDFQRREVYKGFWWFLHGPFRSFSYKVYVTCMYMLSAFFLTYYVDLSVHEGVGQNQTIWHVDRFCRYLLVNIAIFPILVLFGIFILERFESYTANQIVQCQCYIVYVQKRGKGQRTQNRTASSCGWLCMRCQSSNRVIQGSGRIASLYSDIINK
jgi:hypothetical protein